MYQFRILFTCLCAYLPRENDVLVVIPDGRKGHGGHITHDGHAGHGGSQEVVAVPPHVPVIEFDPTELAPGSELKPDLLFRRPASRRDRALLFLTGNDIRIDPASSGAPALRGGRNQDPDSKVPKTAAEAEDFTWIADIKSLNADAGRMDPACIAPGTSANNRVVGRMSLQSGTLSAQMLGLDSESHEPIKFSFVDATAVQSTHPSYSQALASGVAYDLTVLSEEVALVLTPFEDSLETSKKGGRLTFSFAGLPVGSIIEILVKNMPLEGTLELTEAIRPGERIDVDKHFAMYYALSATPPQQKQWIPNSIKARYGAAICAGARFTE